MTKSGNYNGGGSLIKTMNSGRATHLNKRLKRHAKTISNRKRKFENILDEWKKNPPEVKLIKKEDL